MTVWTPELVGSVEDRVQPWLDFANLLPFDIEAPAPDEAPEDLVEYVFEQGAGPSVDRDGNDSVTRFPPRDSLPSRRYTDRVAAARSTYVQFYAVRRILAELVAAHLEDAADTAISLMALGAPTLSFTPAGRIHISADKALRLFSASFDGVDVDRIRRCPECGKFYYAARITKRACDLHLTLMRVRRARGRRGKYEETRRFRKRTGLKAVKGKERERLTKLYQAIGQPSGQEKEES